MKQTDIDKLIQAMKSVFATKDDISVFATKDDISVFATKDDINVFATKDDIKSIEHRLDKLDAKQEFMDTKLDAFFGEILDSRDEQALLSEKSKNHTDQLESHDQRIKVLEKRFSSTPSPVFPAL